jgi:PAS domain S-box-containing protein
MSDPATSTSASSTNRAGLGPTPDGGLDVRAILNAFAFAVYTTDANGVITYFNDAAAALWDRRPAVGKDLWCGSWRIYDTDGNPMPIDLCPMAIALREGRAVVGAEIVIERPDGVRRHVRPNPTPLRDPAGKLIGAINILVDVEELHEGDRARQRLAAIVDSSDDAIVSKNLDGVITSWNAAAERLFGYTAAEAIGRPVTMLIPEAQHDEEPTILERIRSGGRVDHYETTRQRKDGTLIRVSLTVSPVRDANGRVVGASKIARDITERQRSEETRARLAAIVESSDDAIISHDFKGFVTSWNRGAERLFGYSEEEMIRHPLHVLIPAHRREDELALLQRILAGERVEQRETLRQRKDGSSIEVSVTMSPLRDPHGRVIGVSTIARDITARKAAERELELAHQRVLAASRAKDEFIAALSHELRTPLNPVLLIASNGAEDDSLPVEVREDFANIRKHVELEARLIDDLLDITRIARGKLSLQRSPQDLHQLLREAIETVRPDLEEKALELTCNFEPRSAVVLGDAVRLQQVFWNVLRNAVKFTPEGGRVSVRTRGGNQPNWISVEVQDTGIGMTPTELARVFEAFAQGDHAEASAARRFGGLGLGLSIARMLAGLHGGRISARSAGRGQGATFVIELPLSAAAAIDAREAVAPAMSAATTSLMIGIPAPTAGR